MTYRRLKPAATSWFFKIAQQRHIKFKILLMFTLADYIIIFILGVSVLIGLMRGFAKEALSLTTWIVAFIAAFKYNSAFAGYFSHYFQAPSLQIAASFTCIFIGVLLAGVIVGLLVRSIITQIGLGGIDHILGIAFGFARGSLIVGALLLLCTMTSFPESPWWKQSVLIPHFSSVVTWLRGYVPKNIGNIGSNLSSISGVNMPNISIPKINVGSITDSVTSTIKSQLGNIMSGGQSQGVTSSSGGLFSK